MFLDEDRCFARKGTHGFKNENSQVGPRGVAFLIAPWIAFGGTRAVGLAHAQTPPEPTAGAATSNEDPNHEANETPEQEAAEDSGQGFGADMKSPNEDSDHEANETPEQEAAEDSGQGWSGRMHVQVRTKIRPTKLPNQPNEKQLNTLTDATDVG